MNVTNGLTLRVGAFSSLTTVENRRPALLLMILRLVIVAFTWLIWQISWGFSWPVPIPDWSLIIFLVAVIAYSVMTVFLWSWRNTVAALVSLLLLDLGLIATGLVYSGGLTSPYTVLLAWPTLAALLLSNQAFVFLSIVGSLGATGLMVALHYGFSVTPLLGPNLAPENTNLYQAPLFLILLALMGMIGRRGATQEQKTLRTVADMQARLTRAHEELTQSFHDLEASMDRGRTNERIAKETRDQLMRAERFSTTGKLAAGVLHDLSNPLSVIVSEAEMLLLNYEERAPKAREIVKRILGNAQHLSLLIDNLRLLTKQRGDSLFLPVDIRNLVMRCLTSLEPERKRRGVLIDTHLEESVARVLGVESQLEHMVMNLLVNAFEAIDQPGRRVIIRTRTEEDKVLLEVEDEGHGILPEHLNLVFQPFFTTKDSPRSLGLGLFTVLEIADQHDGQVSVRSEPGKQTVFTIVLPVKHPTSGGAKPAA